MTNPAPYPADTRAKGWRFELDYEKVEQSDTWDLAAEIPMAQHSLLMMWLTAWRQEPCGSMPADEELIRSKCKLPAKVWGAVRQVLLRGWWMADDGRLYHPTITARVLEMLDYRRKNAERVAAFKAAKREQQRGNALPTGEQHGRNDTGTGTGTTTEAKASGKRTSPLPCPEDVDETVWADWLKLRKDKGATVTATVLKAARSESVKADLTLEAFLTVWCLRGTQGLQASWLEPHELKVAKAAPVKTFRQADADDARNRVRRMTGGLLGGPQQPDNFIDMESFDVPAIAND